NKPQPGAAGSRLMTGKAASAAPNVSQPGSENPDSENQANGDGDMRAAALFGDSHVAFSPDGNLLAFARRPDSSESENIFILPLSGEKPGEPRQIPSNVTAIGGIAWIAAGRELIFSARLPGRNALELWRMPLSGSRPERLPVGEEVLEPAAGP